MGGLFDSDLIPLLFVLVMLANGFLDRRTRRRRRQSSKRRLSLKTLLPSLNAV